MKYLFASFIKIHHNYAVPCFVMAFNFLYNYKYCMVSVSDQTLSLYNMKAAVYIV